MTNRERMDEGVFRTTAAGREPLATPRDASHVHYIPTRSTGLGCITSRRPGAASDIEYLAFKHGLTVVQVMQILEEAKR